MEPKEFKEFSKIIKEVWFINKHTVNKNNLKKYASMKSF